MIASIIKLIKNVYKVFAYVILLLSLEPGNKANSWMLKVFCMFVWKLLLFSIKNMKKKYIPVSYDELDRLISFESMKLSLNFLFIPIETLEKKNSLFVLFFGIILINTTLYTVFYFIFF